MIENTFMEIEYFESKKLQTIIRSLIFPVTFRINVFISIHHVNVALYITIYHTIYS